jgi:signal transduction histidine kinase
VSDQVHASDETKLRELERRFEALNRMVQVSLVMNSTLKLQPLLQYIMEASTEITGAEAASILLMDKNTNELRFTAATGPDSEGLMDMVVPLEGSIAGAIVSENRAIIIDDAARDPRHFKDVDAEIEFQTRAILGVPMRIRENLIGVLEVLNKRQGRFNDEDLRHITILASQAAVAIENARLVTAIRRANEELEQLNKMKNDFIAIASHELRTPLGVVLGYASFLREEAEGEQAEHAEHVLQSALHLRNLIEDMTNLRYVQIDRAELDMEVVALGRILTAAHSDVIELAEAKEQVLLLELPDHPVEIVADPLKLEMALTNVLNNAVKFTPPRGVIVLSADERHNEVRIRVQDNGIGLDPANVDRIYDQFYQVEDPMTRRHGGLGLGLTIAQAIVQRHDGRIWAESAGIGLGTTINIALPVVRNAAT